MALVLQVQISERGDKAPECLALSLRTSIKCRCFDVSGMNSGSNVGLLLVTSDSKSGLDLRLRKEMTTILRLSEFSAPFCYLTEHSHKGQG